LFTEESQMCNEDGTRMLCCKATKEADLVRATSRDVRATARHLERVSGTMDTSSPAFTALQQALGMTYHPHAILLDRSLDDILDPVNVYMHDWMHGCFVDGVCNVLLYLLFESCIAKGNSNIYTTFGTYLGKWCWPGRLNTNKITAIFEEEKVAKHRKARGIKCPASDLLSIVVVASIFVQHVLMKLPDACLAECKVFLDFMDIVDLILATSRIPIPPERLLAAVEKFLGAFVHVWGYDWMTPKFHWLLHLVDQLRELKRLLNCFCLERKHKVPKRYATDLTQMAKKPTDALLKEVTSHHFGQLSDPNAFSFGVGLVGPKKPTKQLKTLLLAELDIDCDDKDVKWSVITRFSPLATCKKGDMVLFKAACGGRKAGRAQLHLEVEGVPVTLISVFNLVKHDAGCDYAVWSKTADAYSKNTSLGQTASLTLWFTCNFLMTVLVLWCQLNLDDSWTASLHGTKTKT